LDKNTLIKRVQRRDKKAERELFDFLSPKLIILCRRYATDNSQAKDLLQECFIKIFLNVKKFDLSKAGSFEAWAYRVSLNTIRTKIKKRKNVIQLDFYDEIPTNIIEEEVDITEIDDETLIKAIQQLPDMQRFVVNCRIFEGYSHGDIAKELDIPVATSRSHYNRAKKLLKLTLSQTQKKHQIYG